MLLFCPWIGAAISAAGSILGNLLGNNMSTHKAKSLMDYQANIQDRQIASQNNWSEYFYNKYSSPSAMVQQYRDAGLNVGAMMNGTDGVGATQSSASSSVGLGADSSNYNYGENIMQAYQMYLQSQLQSSQIENIEADTKKKEAETQKTTKEVDYIDTQIDFQKITNDWNTQSFDKRLKVLDSEVFKNNSSGALDEQQASNLKAGFPFIASLNRRQLRKLDAEIRSINFDADIKDLQKSIWSLRSRLASEHSVDYEHRGWDRVIDMFLDSPDNFGPTFKRLINGLVSGFSKDGKSFGSSEDLDYKPSLGGFLKLLGSKIFSLPSIPNFQEWREESERYRR